MKLRWKLMKYRLKGEKLAHLCFLLIASGTFWQITILQSFWGRLFMLGVFGLFLIWYRLVIKKFNIKHIEDIRAIINEYSQ